MHKIEIYFLIILSALGVIGICKFVRLLFGYRRTKLRPRRVVCFVFALLLSTVVSVGSMFWFFDCYWIEIKENAPHSFTIEEAMKDYNEAFAMSKGIGFNLILDRIDPVFTSAMSRGIGNYVILDRIDPEFTMDKILLVQRDNNDLISCYIKTRKMLIGMERYFANGGVILVSNRASGEKQISEHYVNGGYDISFPNLWYGIIFPENRDKIRINGKVPYFHNIHFDGADYVVWYIEKDAPEADLVFVES